MTILSIEGRRAEMKKTLFASLLTAGLSFGAVYIVPSWLEPILDSARSSNVVVISQSSPYEVLVSGIPVGDETIDAYYPCTRITKISCRGNGTPRIYGQITGFALVDDDGNAISPTGVDLRAVDKGGAFDVCAAIGGLDGKLYLAKNCSSPSACSVPGNASYVVVNVYQVCK